MIVFFTVINGVIIKNYSYKTAKKQYDLQFHFVCAKLFVVLDDSFILIFSDIMTSIEPFCQADYAENFLQLKFATSFGVLD